MFSLVSKILKINIKNKEECAEVFTHEKYIWCFSAAPFSKYKALFFND